MPVQPLRLSQPALPPLLSEDGGGTAPKPFLQPGQTLCPALPCAPAPAPRQAIPAVRHDPRRCPLLPSSPRVPPVLRQIPGSVLSSPAGDKRSRRALAPSSFSRESSALTRISGVFSRRSAGPQHPHPPGSGDPSAPAAPDPRCRCSPPSPSPGQGRLQARRQLSVACAVCCLFMVGEVIGGYLAHSLAIMTDAAHLLTDVGSMSVSLFSLWVSSRPPTKTMTFGWHRSETLGALASVLSIWVVTAALVYLAAARIISNDYEIESRAMLATSACAVGVNLVYVMAYILHQSPAGHGHGTGAYEHTSVRAAFVHVVGDLLQSVSVLVAATIIYFKPQCKIADPISTLFFSVFVLGSTITILRDVFMVLMEGAPRGLHFDTVKEALLGARGVRGVHDLHLWALTLNHAAVSVHVAVDAGADTEMVLQEVTARLQSRFGFALCTVQVEQHQEESAGCPHCQDPRT
uniref:Probable proton-coupled zinc antiporter SLC30A3 n=1 Tax=Junco hyemalis TaxID=40217 RepID=A0A8C5J2K1_JUNHY